MSGSFATPKKDTALQSVVRQGEEQIGALAGRASALGPIRMDVINDLLQQDPTRSLGFQRSLAQSRGEIGRSLGASGLGDSPFAAALQGQAAGRLAADFEQQRMGQLFQALGLNIAELQQSPELAARFIEMLSQMPDDEAGQLQVLAAFLQAIGR